MAWREKQVVPEIASQLFMPKGSREESEEPLTHELRIRKPGKMLHGFLTSNGTFNSKEPHDRQQKIHLILQAGNLENQHNE
jgi:hypothetical protein